MIKYGILDMLNEHKEGMTQAQIAEATGLSDYAVKCLLEASLTTHIPFICGSTPPALPAIIAADITAATVLFSFMVHFLRS